jgi:hypothetical protein
MKKNASPGAREAVKIAAERKRRIKRWEKEKAKGK